MKSNFCLLTCAALASFICPVAAAPGDLDPTFGDAGRVTTSIGTFGHAVGRSLAIQGDGKIVVAGQTHDGSTYDIAVVRYNVNGTLDTSFNGTGKAVTPVGSSSDDARSVVVQNDGKIVVAGASLNGGTYDFVVVRYNTDGSLDSGFNVTGMVITAVIGGSNGASCVAVQNDGKILAAGYPGMVRYNADGTLDSGFGNGGFTSGIPGGVAYGIALQSDGRIVVAGGSGLARYNTNGALDTSFNGSGAMGGDAASVAVQSDGKIVAAGISYDGPFRDFGIVRCNIDGTLDTTFNGTGRVTCDFGAESDLAYSVLVQSNGKIVVTGDSYSTGGPYDFALARFNVNGTLDTGFGDGGKVLTDFGDSTEYAFGAAFQTNGKVVVAGVRTGAGTGNNFLVARYDGELLNVTGPGTINLGAAATFSVTAAGTGALSYQWKKDGATITGATASSYTIPNAQPWQIGDYTVEVTDSGGLTSSNPALLQITGVPTGLWRGLVAYYPCDGDATDRGPGSASATVSGATLISDRLRQAGRAYDFDGIEDKLTATVPWLPVGSAPRTLSLWAKAGPYASRSVGLAEWGQAASGEAFGIAGSDSPYTWTGKTGGAAAGVHSGVVVDSKWHHLCLSYAGGTLSIYLDGVLKQTAAEAINTGLSALTIGVGVDGSTYFPGSLDEVRIYNRALTSTEVQQLKASEDPDTDHDGILDRFETGTGSFVSAEDTGTSATLADTDGDGLNDGAEVNTHHSNPNVTDTDGDGFPDGFEVNTGFDPASALNTPDALSTLRPAREFRFNAANGVSYRIEGSTDTQNWTTLETNITGAGAAVTRFYVEEELGPRYFLRVRRN